MSNRKGIMLCYPFEEKRLAKWDPPYIVQPKYDGDRCKAYRYEAGYLPVSSEENPFFSVPHIVESLNKSLLWLKLDGELYSHEIHQEGGHELIHSIVSRTVNLHPRYREIEYHLFDIESEDIQIKRLSVLADLAKANIPFIKVAPIYFCNNLDEVKWAYDKIVEQGYEGIVVRHIKADYRTKRSIYLMKFKPKKSDTYKLIGWNEEVSVGGVPKGRIGSLILISEPGYEFSVGAGLTAEQKEMLWEKRHLIGGQEATVFYQHLTNKQIPKGTFDIKIPELGIE